MNLLTEQTLPHPEVLRAKNLQEEVSWRENSCLLCHEALAPNTDAKIRSGFESFRGCYNCRDRCLCTDVCSLAWLQQRM